MRSQIENAAVRAAAIGISCNRMTGRETVSAIPVPKVESRTPVGLWQVVQVAEPEFFFTRKRPSTKSIFIVRVMAGAALHFALAIQTDGVAWGWIS